MKHRTFNILNLLLIFFILSTKCDRESEIYEGIEKELLKLSLSDFEGDPIFIQSVDVANGISTYRLQAESNDTKDGFKFETEQNERGKQIVIIPTYFKLEKHPKIGNKKPLSTVFVVLRIIPGNETKNKYYANYVYTRHATAEDKTILTLQDGDKTCLEWDTWKHRDPNSVDSFVDCKSSIITACQYNNTIEIPKKNYIKSNEKEDDGAKKKIKEMPPLTPESGYSINYYSGVFDDLDDSPSKARKLSRLIKKAMESPPIQSRGLVDLGVLNDGSKKQSKGNSKNKEDNYDYDDVESEEVIKKPKKNTHNTRVVSDSESYIAVTKTRKTKLKDGSTREEKYTEYVACEGKSCGDHELYKKVCNHGVCNMKPAKEEAEGRKIYKQIWTNERRKENGKTIEEKKTKYVEIKIFVKVCADCTQFREASALEDLTNLKLYILTEVDSQVGSESGKLVNKKVDQYVPLDEETIANLYKKDCTTGDGECNFVPLFSRDESAIPTELNGEYTLFTRVTKKKDGTDETLTDYKPVASKTSGNFFTKTCNKAKVCSWEAVTEPNGSTGYYKLLTIRRKIKTGSGGIAQEEVRRFEAQPLGNNGKDVKDFYIMFCYAELHRCVLKPYAKYIQEVASGTKFFRLVIVVRRIKSPNGATREESENKYIPINVYKKECDDAGICTYEPIFNADEFNTSKLPLFILDSETETNDKKKKYTSVTSTVRLEIYTQLCGSKEDGVEVCGMSPVSDEGPTKKLYREIASDKYISTYLYKKICKDEAEENCTMELLTSFDNRILLDRNVYFTITKSKDNKVINEFEPLNSNGPLYEMICQNKGGSKQCKFKSVEADATNIIYNRKRGDTLEEDKFEPITLYGRKCNGIPTNKIKGGDECDMVMLTGEPGELNDYPVWFILVSTKTVTQNKKIKETVESDEYKILSDAAIENLYRKVCKEDNTCKMKPLKESRENTYYILQTEESNNEKEYVPVYLFTKNCDSCEMTPLKQSDDPMKYPVFDLKETSKKNKKGKIEQVYEPVEPENMMNIFRKQCGTDKSKCKFSPLTESEIYKSVTDTTNNKRKFVPVNIYRRACDESGGNDKENCKMRLMRSSDDPKVPLYIAQDPTELKKKDSKNKKTYILFEPEDRSSYYKKICKGGACEYEPLFEDEMVVVRIVPKSTDPPGPPNVQKVKPSQLVPINIVKRKCNEKSDCEFLPLALNDDPRDFELYEVQTLKGKKGTDETKRQYQPLLSIYNPYLFRKRCKDGVCNFTPFFPEDINSIYRKNVDTEDEVGTSPTGRYIPALIYKKICKAGSRKTAKGSKQCDMVKLLYADNPSSFDLFEKLNTQEDGEILRRYNPIIREVDGINYFRKICIGKSSSCEMKPLYESSDETIFRLVVASINQTTPTGLSKSKIVVTYEAISVFTKRCSKNKECDFIQVKPNDDIRSVPLYELFVKKKVTINPKTKKSVTIAQKTYKALPSNTRFELYTESCLKISKSRRDCTYIPILEDEDPIFRLIPLSDGDKPKKYIPFIVFKENCPEESKRDKECTGMTPLKGNDPNLPDDLYTEVKPPPGSPKRKFILLTSDEVSLLYAKSCPENTPECMRPLRTNVYKLIEVPVTTTTAEEADDEESFTPSPQTSSDTPKMKREFVPIDIYKSVCKSKDGKDCKVTKFKIPADDPKCDQIYVVDDTNKESKKTIYKPISPETLSKLYVMSCTDMEKKGCRLVPLLEPTIFFRRVVKKVKYLPEGEIEEERREEMSPIYPYIKSNNPKSKCEMKILSADDPVKPTSIYELETNPDGTKPSDSNFVKKFYPMEEDDVERLYKKICTSNTTAEDVTSISTCRKEPLFPKMYYEWRIIVIDGLKYKDQIPVKLVVKDTENCKGEVDQCNKPLDITDESDDKIKIYKLTKTLKKKKNPEDPDKIEKKYIRIRTNERANFHRRVCNSVGFCIPKKLSEKSSDKNIHVFKLMPVAVTTPDNQTKVKQQLVPVKIFLRNPNPNDTDVMNRITTDDGPIENIKEPIYLKVIIVRRKKTIDTEIEERINKFIKLTPTTSKYIFVKTCNKPKSKSKKTTTAPVCALVPLGDDKTVIYKKVTKRKNKKEITTYMHVKLYKCKKSLTKPDEKCTLQKVTPEDNLSDPKSPTYILVKIKKTDNKYERKLVKVTKEDITNLYIKTVKTNRLERLKPPGKVTMPKKETPTTPDEPDNFMEVPSDTSVEVEDDDKPPETTDETDDSEIDGIPTEDSVAPYDSTVIPETDEKSITEPDIFEETTEAPMEATTTIPDTETQVEKTTEFKVHEEIDKVIRRKKVIREDLVIITETRIVKTKIIKRTEIEMDTEKPVEAEVVKQVTQPTSDVVPITSVVETKTESSITVIEKPDTEKKKYKKITKETSVQEETIIYKRQKNKEKPIEKGSKVEEITKSSIDKNTVLETTTNIPTGGDTDDETNVFGENVKPVTEKKTRFQITEAPIDEVSPTDSPKVKGELEISTTESTSTSLVSDAPETTETVSTTPFSTTENETEESTTSSSIEKKTNEETEETIIKKKLNAMPSTTDATDETKTSTKGTSDELANSSTPESTDTEKGLTTSGSSDSVTDPSPTQTTEVVEGTKGTTPRSTGDETTALIGDVMDLKKKRLKTKLQTTTPETGESLSSTEATLKSVTDITLDATTMEEEDGGGGSKTTPSSIGDQTTLPEDVTDLKKKRTKLQTTTPESGQETTASTVLVKSVTDVTLDASTMEEENGGSGSKKDETTPSSTGDETTLPEDVTDLKKKRTKLQTTTPESGQETTASTVLVKSVTDVTLDSSTMEEENGGSGSKKDETTPGSTGDETTTPSFVSDTTVPGDVTEIKKKKTKLDEETTTLGTSPQTTEGSVVSSETTLPGEVTDMKKKRPKTDEGTTTFNVGDDTTEPSTEYKSTEPGDVTAIKKKKTKSDDGSTTPNAEEETTKSGTDSETTLEVPGTTKKPDEDERILTTTFNTKEDTTESTESKTTPAAEVTSERTTTPNAEDKTTKPSVESETTLPGELTDLTTKQSQSDEGTTPIAVLETTTLSSIVTTISDSTTEKPDTLTTEKVISESVIVESVMKVCREETTLKTEDGKHITFVTDINTKPRRPLKEVIINEGEGNYTVVISSVTEEIIKMQEIIVHFKPNFKLVYELPIENQPITEEGTKFNVETSTGMIVFTIYSARPTEMEVTIKDKPKRIFVLPEKETDTEEDIPTWDSTTEEIQSTTIQTITTKAVLRKTYTFETPPKNLYVIFEVKPKEDPSKKSNSVIEIVEKIIFQTPTENITFILPVNETEDTEETKDIRPRFRLRYTPENGEPIIFEFPIVGFPDSPKQVEFRTPDNMFLFDIPKNPEVKDIAIIFIPKPKRKYVYDLPRFTVVYSEDPNPKDKKPIKLVAPKDVRTTTITKDKLKVTIVSREYPNSSKPNVVKEIIIQTKPTPTTIKFPKRSDDENSSRFVIKPKGKGKSPKIFEFPKNKYVTIVTNEKTQITKLTYKPKGMKPQEFVLPEMKPDDSTDYSEEDDDDEPGKRTKTYSTSDHETLINITSVDSTLSEDKTRVTIPLQIVISVDKKKVEIELPKDPNIKNPLLLAYTDQRTKEVTTYQFPVSKDPKDGQPTISTPQGTLIFDLTASTSKNLIIKFRPKKSKKTSIFKVPNFVVQDNATKKSTASRFEMTFNTIEKQQLTIVTTGEPEDPSTTPSHVIELIFHLQDGSMVTIPFLDDPSLLGMNLQLTHTAGKNGNISIYEFPEIPMIKTKKSKKITYQPKNDPTKILVLDIPKPEDESRSGVKFILKMDDGMKEVASYEIPGFALRGNVISPKPVPMDVTFQTTDPNKSVLLRTVLPPGQEESSASTMYRIRYAVFQVGKKEISVKMSKPIAPSADDPQWLRIRYISEDEDPMDFEIPGVKADPNGRKRKLKFNSPDGKLLVIIPRIGNKKSGIEMKLSIGKKEVTYILPGFVQVGDTDLEGSSNDDGDASLEEEFDLGRSLKGGGNVTRNLLFFHPGWKYQYVSATRQGQLEHESDIFYGLGNCPYTPTTPTQLNQSYTADEVIKFYLRVMRTDCLSEILEYILSLIDGAYLVLDEKQLVIPQRQILVSKAKLNAEEATKLLSAFEMDALTKTYVTEIRQRTSNPKSPDDSPISRSTIFLSEFSMNYISKSLTVGRLHSIRLLRHLVETLKIVFTKLIQDRKELESCENCSQDIEINHNDQIQIMALMQFVMHGLEPVDKGKEEVDEAFTKFFIQNKASIETRINVY